MKSALTSKFYKKTVDGGVIRTTLDLGFYKRMSVKEFWARENGAPTKKLRAIVTAAKGPCGTMYSIYYDDMDLRINASMLPMGTISGQMAMGTVIENWARHSGSICLVAEKITELVRGGSKNYPKMNAGFAAGVANDLAANLLEVAKYVGEDNVRSVKIGADTYALSEWLQ